jgi:hypothetical protein
VFGLSPLMHGNEFVAASPPGSRSQHPTAASRRKRSGRPTRSPNHLSWAHR